MIAKTMSFHYELARKGFSVEKAHHLVTLQNDLCSFIGLTFTLSLKLSFFTIVPKVKTAVTCLPFNRRQINCEHAYLVTLIYDNFCSALTLTQRR